MGVIVALTVGLVFWLTVWSFGIKAFDAFLVTALLVLVATAARLMAPWVNKVTGR